MCQDNNEFVLQDLRKWTADFNITQSALKGILKIINTRFNANLCSDPQTIMKTPRNVNLVQVGSSDTGEEVYWHQKYYTN